MQSFLRTIRHNTIVRQLALPTNATVLDTSCQDGGFLTALINHNIDRNPEVYGVDISEGDITIARRALPEGIFEVTDNVTLPFTDEMFDVVISSMTLHHMSAPLRSLSEMERVLKQNGSIYLVDVIADSTVAEWILKRVSCPEPYHFEKFYSLRELKTILAQAGLHIKSKKNVWVFPTWSIATPVMVVELGRGK